MPSLHLMSFNEPTGYNHYRVNHMRSELTIGELSKATGVKVVTIRVYEKTGILAVPARSAGNYRIFRSEHVRRLHFIRRCRDLGFSLDQVRDFLRLSTENTA